MNSIYLIVVLGYWLLSFLMKITPILFNCFCRYCLAGFFTPRGHKRYGDFNETVAYRDLKAEGYSVEPKFAMDAVASIRTD